jgi:hypothetical protein
MASVGYWTSSENCGKKKLVYPLYIEVGDFILLLIKLKAKR